ncbi:MAG: cytochrome C peroxidase [Gammaproteobacteria bacterium]|nr:cytochrome C peroxidase [Gammaproteobacteria bacterium]
MKPVNQTFICISFAAFFLLPFTSTAWAESVVKTPSDARSHGLEDLRTAIKSDGGVPLPDLSDVLKPGKKAKEAFQQLGKLLFWDQSVGSNGQACASCHFHAGTDNRSKNQLNPDLLRVRNDREGDILGFHNAESVPDTTFQTRQPNQRLRPGDFPFIKTIQEVTYGPNGIVEAYPGNSNDVASSQGVLRKKFIKVRKGLPKDKCKSFADPVFQTVHGRKVRRVAPRNTPTTYNAVLNAFNFWDGRANHFFNGRNVFGVQDPSARIFVFEDQQIKEKRVAFANSSLASQAVGPPLNDFEMSCGVPMINNARTFPEIGKKLLRKRNGQAITPLKNQFIHPKDSLIGSLSNAPKKGANVKYRQLIETAFKEKYWRSPEFRVVFDGIKPIIRPPGEGLADPAGARVLPMTTMESLNDIQTPNNPMLDEPIDTDSISAQPAHLPRFTLMEANFSLFWGLSIQAYQALLLSDDSSFDRWMRNGKPNKKFGKAEIAGLNVFIGKGKCLNCHGGPELTNASVRNFQRGHNLIEPMRMGDDRFAIYDNGFYNIGVTPTVEDIGRGGQGPAGAPLASSRQRLFKEVLNINLPFKIIGGNKVSAIIDSEGKPVCRDVNGDGFCSEKEPLFDDFQRVAVDGAMKTPGLRNILLQGPYFHNGSTASLRQVVEFYDNGGNFCRINKADLSSDILPLGLTEKEKTHLVKFLVSLTDRRVQFQKAPFDHPSLVIPLDGRNGKSTLKIPAVGRNGARKPLGTFLGLKPQFIGKAPTDVVCSIY